MKMRFSLATILAMIFALNIFVVNGQSEVIFSETFDTSNEQWFQLDGVAEISDGQYKLTLDKNGKHNYVDSTNKHSNDLYMTQDYLLSFDLFNGSCTGNCALSLVFNARNNKFGEYVKNQLEYYPTSPFRKTTGAASLYGAYDDNPTYYGEIDSNYAAIPAPLFDGQSHHVELKVSEFTTDLIIDSELVVTFGYNLRLEGGIGIGIRKGDNNDEVSVVIDNVTVKVARTAAVTTVDISALPFAISHNLEVAVPLPDTWSQEQPDPFIFSIGIPGAGETPEGISVLVIFDSANGLNAVSTVQTLTNAQQTYNFDYGDSSNLTVGTEIMPVVSILDNGVETGLVTARRIRDNYFVTIVAGANSVETWQANRDLVTSIVTNIRAATNEELAKSRDNIITSTQNLPVVDSTLGFSINLPDKATLAPNPALLPLGLLADIGAAFDIRPAFVNNQDFQSLRLWKFSRSDIGMFLNVSSFSRIYHMGSTSITTSYANLDGSPVTILEISGVLTVYGIFITKPDNSIYGVVIESNGSIDADMKAEVQAIASSIK